MNQDLRCDGGHIYNNSPELTHSIQHETPEPLQEVPCANSEILQNVSSGNPEIFHHLNGRISNFTQNANCGNQPSFIGSRNSEWQQAIIVSPDQVLPFRLPQRNNFQPQVQRIHTQAQAQRSHAQSVIPHSVEEQVRLRYLLNGN